MAFVLCSMPMDDRMLKTMPTRRFVGAVLAALLLAGCAATPGPPVAAPPLGPPTVAYLPAVPATEGPMAGLLPTPTPSDIHGAQSPALLPTEETQAEPCQASEHVVTAEETLEMVAATAGLPAVQLAAINRIDVNAPLQPGQVVVIPCTKPVESPEETGALLLLATPTPIAAADTLPAAEAVTLTNAAVGTGAADTLAALLPGRVITEVVGWSAGGRPLVAYVLGNGPTRLALIGGIHGGYEWNTILLAYQILDYLLAHPEAMPPSLTVYLLPSANPDGQALVAGSEGRFVPAQLAADTRPGRMNGNNVDLNRNWDCHWAPTGLWGTTEVSGGSGPMSEPETQALATWLTKPPMDAVLFWHSAATGVFAGGCQESFEPGIALAQVYAATSGYPFQAAFTSYAVTGDAADWLALQGVPAIEVELSNHDDLDWEMNLRGVLALLEELGKR